MVSVKSVDSARAEETAPSLAALAALGPEELTADLERALPGEVPAAVFNSSI